MIQRPGYIARIGKALSRNPVAMLVGPRLVPDTLQESLIGVQGSHVDPEGWIRLVERWGRHASHFGPLTERTGVKRDPIMLPTAPDP